MQFYFSLTKVSIILNHFSAILQDANDQLPDQLPDARAKLHRRGFRTGGKVRPGFRVLQARPQRCQGACGVVSQFLVGERREHEDQANGFLRHPGGGDCGRRTDVHGMGRTSLHVGGVQLGRCDPRRKILMM